jgi:hypothetical protein
MKKMTLALFLASLSFGTANASCDTSFCGSLTLPQNPPVQMKNLVAVCDSGMCKTETPVVPSLKDTKVVACGGNSDPCDSGGGTRGLHEEAPVFPSLKMVACGNGDCEPGTKTQTLTPAQIKNLIADNCTGDYCNDGGGVRG